MNSFLVTLSLLSFSACGNKSVEVEDNAQQIVESSQDQAKAAQHIAVSTPEPSSAPAIYGIRFHMTEEEVTAALAKNPVLKAPKRNQRTQDGMNGPVEMIELEFDVTAEYQNQIKGLRTIRVELYKNSVISIMVKLYDSYEGFEQVIESLNTYTGTDVTQKDNPIVQNICFSKGWFIKTNSAYDLDIQDAAQLEEAGLLNREMLEYSKLSFDPMLPKIYGFGVGYPIKETGKYLRERDIIDQTTAEEATQSIEFEGTSLDTKVLKWSPKNSAGVARVDMYVFHNSIVSIHVIWKGDGGTEKQALQKALRNFAGAELKPGTVLIKGLQVEQTDNHIAMTSTPIFSVVKSMPK